MGKPFLVPEDLNTDVLASAYLMPPDAFRIHLSKVHACKHGTCSHAVTYA